MKLVFKYTKASGFECRRASHRLEPSREWRTVLIKLPTRKEKIHNPNRSGSKMNPFATKRLQVELQVWNQEAELWAFFDSYKLVFEPLLHVPTFNYLADTFIQSDLQTWIIVGPCNLLGTNQQCIWSTQWQVSDQPSLNLFEYILYLIIFI